MYAEPCINVKAWQRQPCLQITLGSVMPKQVQFLGFLRKVFPIIAAVSNSLRAKARI